MAINWHDLFRATHTGRIISAVMVMVSAMRMQSAFGGGSGRSYRRRRSSSSLPPPSPLAVTLVAVVFGFIVCTAALTHWHSRARKAYMEVGRLRRAARGKRMN